MKSNGLSDFGYAPDKLTHYIGNYVSAWLTKLKVRCEREADVANSILRELMGSRSLANNAMYESTVNRSTMIWLKWIGNMQIF